MSNIKRKEENVEAKLRCRMPSLLAMMEMSVVGLLTKVKRFISFSSWLKLCSLKCGIILHFEQSNDANFTLVIKGLLQATQSPRGYK